jgi:hypothetical protein
VSGPRAPRPGFAALRGQAGKLGRERSFLLVLWCLAVLGCALGLKPAPEPSPGVSTLEQAIDLVRIVATTALVIVLVFGPGLALAAARSGRDRGSGSCRCPEWRSWHSSAGSPGVSAPGSAGSIRASSARRWSGRSWSLCRSRSGASRRDELLAPEEWRVLALVAGAFGIALGRALWSLDLPGELYAGQIYRTLEVGDRPDSRISFHIVELVANGETPYGTAATSYLSPYTFSDRGPLAGLASAPIVLLTGGKPPVVIGTPPWTPFDPQGFMAYRLAMMTFASTCFLSLWTLVRRLAGGRAAHFAALLAVTTPFLVHEVWFTWPKLLAASLVLLSAVSLIDARHVRAGLLLGVAYLVHPLALLSLPALGLLALWPLVGARLRRPQLGSLLMFVVGAGACLLLWRLVNGHNYTQNGFLNYLTQAGATNTLMHIPVTLTLWLDDRFVSVANTLFPLRLFFLSSMNQEVNSALQPCFPLCSGGSPAIEHFFFQYWNTLPFGMGIVFYPLLLVSLWRALRRWPWPVTATVIVPFLAFAIYWGGAATGLLREGMHVWVLTLVAVVAIEQHASGFAWMRSRVVRALLTLRAFEVLLVAMLPTIWTLHELASTQFMLTDIVAVIAMVGLCAFLGAQVWRWNPGAGQSPRGRAET